MFSIAPPFVNDTPDTVVLQTGCQNNLPVFGGRIGRFFPSPLPQRGRTCTGLVGRGSEAGSRGGDCTSFRRWRLESRGRVSVEQCVAVPGGGLLFGGVGYFVGQLYLLAFPGVPFACPLFIRIN